MLTIVQLSIIPALFLINIEPINAFILDRLTLSIGTDCRRKKRPSSLKAQYRDDGDYEDPEVDAARVRFEALLSSSSSPVKTDPPSYSRKLTGNLDRSARTINAMLIRLPFPPLTAIMRERQIKEIELLSALEESEEAVDELWTLWFTERGHTAATLLFQAEELVSKGEVCWKEAETMLWNIIFEYGVHWAEPINRLATLKFLQGKLGESKELCEIVLKLKPWHFGALSGIVMVCAGLQDVNNARMWADRRLPPLIPKNATSGRRKQWIENACRDARKRLFIAEKDRARHNLGEEEMKFRMMRQGLQKDLGDENNATEEVWQ